MNELEYALSQIPYFDYVHERLFCSGQLTAENLEQIKAYGCSTIINLASSKAEMALRNEDQLCLDLDLNYIHIPLDNERPSANQAILVLELINHLVCEQTVWLHCADNRQCSVLMYLYRQYFMNIDMPTAQEYLHRIWEPDDTWTGLIHAVALQLQGRKATRELEQSLMQVRQFV